MKKGIKKAFLWIGGICLTTAGVVVYTKQANKNAFLEGENKALKDQLDSFRANIVKKMVQQSYYNGKSAERAASNIEEK